LLDCAASITLDCGAFLAARNGAMQPETRRKMALMHFSLDFLREQPYI
jgi:hypothetical protein